MNRRRGVAYAVAGILLLLFGGRWAAIRFTEASWFADLGLGRAYWGRLAHDLAWQGAVGLAAALWYAAQTWAVYRSIGAVHLPRRVGDLEFAEAVPRRTLRWIALGTALLLGVVTAMTFSDVPDLVALYRHAVPLDIREPILGNDASFYLARLPLLEALHLVGLVMVLFGVFVSAGLYALTGSITYAERRLRATPHARSHLVVLAGILALVLAWGFQLDAWDIVGGGGSAQGALAAADRAIRIPASTALAALALVVAAGTVGSLRWRRPGILLTLWATLAVATLLGRYVAPYLSDAWGGRPDRAVSLALAQYADRYSRAGLGLLGIARPERLAAAPMVPPESLEALGRELGGISPWDVEPGALAAALNGALPDTARERAWTIAFDRYAGATGQSVLAALAVPETDQLEFARGPRRPDWTLLHRGALSWAGDPVAVVAGHWADGLLFLGRLGPTGDSTTTPVPLERAAGRVRFLARAADPAVVGPDEPAPAGAPSGLRVGGFLRRLLLAWALQMPPLLDRRTSVADRLLIWRDVPRRLARLYPFTTFDTPHPALVDGRLLWLADGYLASVRFPLAEQVSWNGDAVNFLRAAYVATVDAVTGATRLYLRPPDMRFAAELAAGTGTPALPSDSLSADLRQHLGYPDQLFVAQAEMLARHRGDADVTAEPWVPAAEEAGVERRAEPATPRDFAALVGLTGEAPRLWRLMPLTDTAGNQLVALVAGTCRSDGTLWLRLLQLPEAGFPTLAAAENRLASSPTVEAAMAEAAGPDGASRRGMIMAVPTAGTVAYAQFLLATRRKAGEALLPRALVLLAANRLGIGEGTAAAARSLVAASPSPAAATGSAAALAEARAALAAMDSAFHRGDWAAFGRAYESLRRVLGVGPARQRRP